MLCQIFINMNLKRIIKEELNKSEDEWEWAKTTNPVELENPKDWVGRSFRKAKSYPDSTNIDTINPYEYSGQYYTVVGLDENGNVSLVRNYLGGESYDVATKPQTIIKFISNGTWEWI